MYEYTILTNQDSVKIHLTTAVFGPLDLHQIPVHRAAVRIVTIVIGIARGEVDRSENLLIEERVVHRLENTGIATQGKFTDVPGSLINIKDIVQQRIVIGMGLYDFSILEGETHLLEAVAVVGTFGIVGNRSLY